MKNYIYMAIMMIPSVAFLIIILAFSFIVQLFYLPETILNLLWKYDREQERKKMFPEQYKIKGDKK